MPFYIVSSFGERETKKKQKLFTWLKNQRQNTFFLSFTLFQTSFLVVLNPQKVIFSYKTVYTEINQELLSKVTNTKYFHLKKRNKCGTGKSKTKSYLAILFFMIYFPFLPNHFVFFVIRLQSSFYSHHDDGFFFAQNKTRLAKIWKNMRRT